MDKLKALRVGIVLFQLFSICVLALSLHTLFSVLSTVISGETLNFGLDIDESTEDWMFTLDAHLMNKGYIGVKLSFELSILTLDEKSIAKNVTSVYIKAGGSQSFSMNLFLPAEVVRSNNLVEEEGSMKINFTVRTFWNLIGFTNILKIGGGI